MADWQAIKTEYITTDTSYRKLSQKYGVNVTNIAKKAGTENWVEDRKQYTSKTLAKTLEKISAQEASRAAKILSVADKLLLQIEAKANREEPLDEKAIRTLTAAVKDLKEIYGVRSKLDQQEQEARIANLRKQAEADADKTDEIKVTIVGDLEEYSR